MTHELPPDPEGMNERRATLAENALTAFWQETGDDKEAALRDLLTDLMHWCDRNHHDFDAELDRSRLLRS
jgi:hypothetical protein